MMFVVYNKRTSRALKDFQENGKFAKGKNLAAVEKDIAVLEVEIRHLRKLIKPPKAEGDSASSSVCTTRTKCKTVLTSK